MRHVSSFNMDSEWLHVKCMYELYEFVYKVMNFLNLYIWSHEFQHKKVTMFWIYEEKWVSFASFQFDSFFDKLRLKQQGACVITVKYEFCSEFLKFLTHLLSPLERWVYLRVDLHHLFTSSCGLQFSWGWSKVMLVKGTSHDSIFQIILFSTLGDIFAV